MAAQAQAAQGTSRNGATPTARTVIVIDRDLPKGLAANAAAVLAHGFGSRVPGLIGADFDDAAGASHTGLIPTGLPVLGADGADLPALRAAAVERDVGVVAADHAVRAQRADPLGRGRRRHVDGLGKLAVRAPRVLLELAEERVVDRVEAAHRAAAPDDVRRGAPGRTRDRTISGKTRP